MLMGAIIGGALGVVIYLIQNQQKKKKESETIDKE